MKSIKRIFNKLLIKKTLINHGIHYVTTIVLDIIDWIPTNLSNTCRKKCIEYNKYFFIDKRLYRIISYLRTTNKLIICYSYGILYIFFIILLLFHIPFFFSFSFYHSFIINLMIMKFFHFLLFFYYHSIILRHSSSSIPFLYHPHPFLLFLITFLSFYIFSYLSHPYSHFSFIIYFIMIFIYFIVTLATLLSSSFALLFFSLLSLAALQSPILFIILILFYHSISHLSIPLPPLLYQFLPFSPISHQFSHQFFFLFFLK